GSQIFFADEINKEVFSKFDPYQAHASKRTTFNDNDPFKQGVYSDVTRQPGAYAAKAVLVVPPRYHTQHKQWSEASNMRLKWLRAVAAVALFSVLLPSWTGAQEPSASAMIAAIKA